MSQRQKNGSDRYDNDYMAAYNDKHLARHRSGSRSPFYHRKHRTEKSYSRSRSRSLNSNRRSHSDKYFRSRSRSGSTGQRSRYYSTCRHKNSKGTSSYSKSGSRSPAYQKTSDSSRRASTSLSSKKTKHGDSVRKHNSEQGSDCRSNFNYFEKSMSTASSLVYNTSESQSVLHNIPPSKCDAIGIYYNLNIEEPIDKERIHKEIEEKLRQALAKEGKVYPPKKPEASHPVFANDGSFLEIFKKMQESQKLNSLITTTSPAIIPTTEITATACSSTTTHVAAGSSRQLTPAPPMVGRRRGGKILKTGVVAKPKTKAESDEDPKDFWSLYLAEVNKYKNNACESDGGTRPLVK